MVFGFVQLANILSFPPRTGSAWPFALRWSTAAQILGSQPQSMLSCKLIGIDTDNSHLYLWLDCLTSWTAKCAISLAEVYFLLCFFSTLILSG